MPGAWLYAYRLPAGLASLRDSCACIPAGIGWLVDWRCPGRPASEGFAFAVGVVPAITHLHSDSLPCGGLLLPVRGVLLSEAWPRVRTPSELVPLHAWKARGHDRASFFQKPAPAESISGPKKNLSLPIMAAAPNAGKVGSMLEDRPEEDAIDLAMPACGAAAEHAVREMLAQTESRERAGLLKEMGADEARILLAAHRAARRPLQES